MTLKFWDLKGEQRGLLKHTVAARPCDPLGHPHPLLWPRPPQGAVLVAQAR